MKASSAESAVAVDLGASSLRFAHGILRDGTIQVRIVDQVPNAPVRHNGRLEWDLDSIIEFCRRAAEFARDNQSSLGIDSWGVDVGYFGNDGELLGPVVCYRDDSHVKQFERFSASREQLFEWTGIQHQPFNTIYQMAARADEDPSLPLRTRQTLHIPDLVNYLLTGFASSELTQASTSQLVGLDNAWSKEAFDLIGWPVPPELPHQPGRIIGKAKESGVDIVSVGSHDTASGVCGLGQLGDDQAYLIAGTWSLLGCVLPEPNLSAEAQAANFTNERAVDGNIRFLDNIPGFYVVNRLHHELQIRTSIGTWLLQAEAGFNASVDLFDPAFFNPLSMVEAVRQRARPVPDSDAQFASTALNSMVQTVACQLKNLERATHRRFREIRVGGGGSESVAFCRGLAKRTGLPILGGPREATILGNLGIQFLARGHLKDFSEVFETLNRSVIPERYEPEDAK